MQPNRPLLTIAIPTYNRMVYLSELLSVLEDQVVLHPEVQLLVLDNASPDGTANTVQEFINKGMPIKYHRHAENIGSDANFVACLNQAEGKYFWLCGDDDIILPNTLDEVAGHLKREDFDLVYLTSYGFKKNYVTERQGDPLKRSFHRITSARHFSKAVNIMFTFISGMIVNKDRLAEVSHEDPERFIDSNLIQLSWVLPLLQEHRRSLILWNRPVAARQGNAGGYALGEVFGKGLVEVTARCLPNRPDIAANILNFTVRRWLPSILYQLRRDENGELDLESARPSLQYAYGANIRYWLFSYPVLVMPLPLARIWFRGGAVISQLIYAISMPTFWRKEI